MKEEILRLDRVTCMDQGVAALHHFCLRVTEGDILGLIPINGVGVHALLRLLRQNLPMHYGYVYFREQLVNHWQRSDGSYNRVTIIDNRSGLADDLTVADNVFVLRPGFGKHLISRGLLRRQLAPFLQEIGVDISADARARDLSAFERVVVELVKAAVAGHRLILLIDAGTIVSDTELRRLHDILRHYAAQGISFLYVSQHYEEVRQVCDKAALMLNGRIAKVLATSETTPEQINCFGVERFDRMVRTQGDKRTPDRQLPPALDIHNLHAGRLQGLNLTVAQGECVVLQDLDNSILDDLLSVVTGARRPQAGRIHVDGDRRGGKLRRNTAVIQQLATQSMLFPEMSYLDNLCFTMDHRLPGVWLRRAVKRSVCQEFAGWLGRDVFDLQVDALTPLQKYDLIYARVLLQRPKVVFCVQPFMQSDVAQRMHIWQLLERLLKHGIAVVILAVNLADTLSLADRLVRVQDGRVVDICAREAFGTLPDSVPWNHLWDR